MRTIKGKPIKHAAVIVAHPDDEVLWAGGLILSDTEHQWSIVALTRKSDPDRAPKFYQVLDLFKAQGDLGDLEDGPEQTPLSDVEIRKTILNVLQPYNYHLILTHGPQGEYTRHRRHEETSTTVSSLWKAGLLSAERLWMFAYQDNGGQDLPTAVKSADFRHTLSNRLWHEKYRILTQIYGFSPYSWEARVTPRIEGFWCFNSPAELHEWAPTNS